MASESPVAAPPRPRPARPPTWKPRPRGLVHSVFFTIERLIKEVFFGCQMCGQCILHNCGYVCPMRCPKHLRNGPCGGYDADQHCEVYPERPCAWVRVYRRSGLLRKMDEYNQYRQPLDHGLWGTASWYNLIVARTIDLHGHTFRKLPPED
ncbi:MAG: methylenetetrahydrofolate reductase C-terminal domain-containing protein [Armatimonadota bacterium]